MNTMETICSRKSVRSYTNELITKKQLELIVKAANAAPVGMGKYEDVHLTVITNHELLNQIDEAGARMFKNPELHPLYHAPMLILISSKLPNDEAMRNVSYSNAAILAQNMALEATELGIGVCHIWGATMAILNDAKLLEKLNLPAGFVPCCAITLGKTDYQYQTREIPMDRIVINTIE